MELMPLVPLRIAFVGGALNSAVGYTHFNASRLDGHFRVEAGCFSRHQAQNEKTANTYGVSSDRVYSTWQDLLQEEQGRIDAIVILTPTPTHAEIAIAALDAGYPVICEKALGVSRDQCQVIQNSVLSNNGYLALTYNYSGYPMVRELQRMIAEGRLGKIHQIHIEMPQEGFLRLGACPQDWRLSDYAVPTVSLDLGVHVHHLIHFLTSGAKPLRLVGEQTSYGQFDGLIDNVYCIAQYEKDIRVVAWWGKTALGCRNGLRIRVYGSEGSAEWFQMDPENLRWADNNGHFFMLDRGSGEADIAQQQRYNRFKPGHPSGFIEAFANLYSDIASDLRRLINIEPLTPERYVFGAAHARDGLDFLEKISYSSQVSEWVKF